MNSSSTLQRPIGQGGQEQAVYSATSVRSDKAVGWIVLLSLVYQAILCFIHTHIHPITTAGVGAGEMCIFLGCLVMLGKRSDLSFVALIAMTVAYLFLLALFRDQLDPKGIRDVMIPILFFELGRQYCNSERADRLIFISIGVVLLLGFFELFFLDAYSKIFNIFSYYVSQGSVLPNAGWAKDSVLSLNGMRPEGIGRTILPAVFGSHRISSVFLEPVSLGNFAVIVACWALSRDRQELRKTLIMLGLSMLMIALADSRYGLLTVGVLIAMRFVFPKKLYPALIVLPLLCVVMLVSVALFMNVQYADNILGRLFLSGHTMLGFDLPMIFGLVEAKVSFGDMGYPAMLIHLGLPLCVFLWSLFWMVRMRDERGNSLRAYAAVYMSFILCVSGSSMFALKSAGLLWFLLGCSARLPDEKKISIGGRSSFSAFSAHQ